MSRPRVLHLLDAGLAPPRLLPIVRGSDPVLTRRCGHDLVRLRAALEVRAQRPDIVVAWSRAAARAAVAANVAHVLWRPVPHDVRPLARATALCHSKLQHRRLGGHLLPDPLPATPTVSRESRGISELDVLWLLSCDTGPHAGLPRAAWAATLMHVLMRREGKRHRLLLDPGPARPLRRLRRFVDQLGIPGLGVPIEQTIGLDYGQLAGLADGAVFSPTGFCDPWPARVAVAAGLPIVATNDVAGGLADAEHVHHAASDKPRHIAREMLRHQDRQPRRPAPTDEAVADVGAKFAALLEPAASPILR
jgi:hypothetical protein